MAFAATATSCSDDVRHGTVAVPIPIVIGSLGLPMRGPVIVFTLLNQLANFCHQVGRTAAIAPFVIVPAKNLGHVAFAFGEYHG